MSDAVHRPTWQRLCPWPRCHKRLEVALWGCREHWYRLPLALRERFLRAFRREQLKNGSGEQIGEARAAITAWIQDAETPARMVS